MQGQRSSVSTLPENISFDHGSTSTDVGVDSQMSWNSMQTSAQNLLPDYRISSSGPTNIPYMPHVRHEARNAEWSLGETSSRAARQYEPSNILSFDNVDVNSNGNQATNGSYLLHNPTLPQDLNMIGDQEDDDCQVVERPSSYINIGSSNDQMQSTGSSSSDSSEDRPGCSLDGRRISCKRKALEVHAGPSSGVGSSNCLQHAERRQWHSIPPPPHIASSNINMSQNNLVINNGPEQANSRLRLGVGGTVSPSPFSLTPSGNAESSRRNFRVRVNGSHQQPDNPFAAEADGRNADVSSSRHSSRLVLRNRLFDLNPTPPVENAGLHGQSVLHIPSVRRSHQTRWSARTSSSSTASAIPEERAAAFYEEPTSRNIPRSISEHPMFVPDSETGSSSQNPANWNLAAGNNSVAGNVASTSRVGPNSPAPGWSHRSCPQYPRRLSELVRRSLASSAGIEPGGPSGSNPLRSGSSATYQEIALPSGPDNPGHRAMSSRSALFERQIDGAFGIPYSLRTLAAASEGRSSIVSEIRHVLDLMRRGEGLRFEDVMILDHSVLFGMADIHDRHRDMRLDVDNMSYEELLALEERIGNVCTGLSEETIMSRLKQKKYVDNKVEDPAETEPCSICREEYNEEEDVGTLECGHDFHRDCIKQWLMQKNLCPICKTTGLNTTTT